MSHSLNDVTPLRWRPGQDKDLVEVQALVAAIAAFDDTSQRVSLDELEAWFETSGPLAPDLMALGYEGSSMVAVGWLTVSGAEPTVRLDGAVHPAFRHQGIGRALLRWQIHRARDWFVASEATGPLRMVAFSDASMSNKRSLFTNQGFEPSRWLIDMICPFPTGQRVAEFVATPVLGVRFEPFGPRWMEATRQAHNEAFADRWGSREVDPHTWAESLARAHARPDLSWVAVDQWDTVVGYALNSASDELGGPALGWTDRIGVRPAQRGRNIARVLLARSLDSFRRAGMDAGGVGLDSVDGRGTALYQSLGYEPVDTIIQYQRIETPEEARAALTS
ncbi:MAG: GNAT family N-acetyltransferase [Propionibacteriaceae bacterium]|nr:GNAT family N-acetyltransferase [Propionibacteriaceae bacterium]